MAIDVSEEIARKGQEVREMTRELDLIKVEVDIIANVIRFRGAPAPASVHGEDASEGCSDTMASVPRPTSSARRQLPTTMPVLQNAQG